MEDSPRDLRKAGRESFRAQKNERRFEGSKIWITVRRDLWNAGLKRMKEIFKARKNAGKFEGSKKYAPEE